MTLSISLYPGSGKKSWDFEEAATSTEKDSLIVIRQFSFNDSKLRAFVRESKIKFSKLIDPRIFFYSEDLNSIDLFLNENNFDFLFL